MADNTDLIGEGDALQVLARVRRPSRARHISVNRCDALGLPTASNGQEP